MKRRGLPLFAAVRLGLRGILTHPVRLLIVLILTTCALVMFGLSAIAVFYDNDEALVRNYLLLEPVTEFYKPGAEEEVLPILQSDLEELTERTQIHFSPVAEQSFLYEGRTNYSLGIFGEISLSQASQCIAETAWGGTRVCHMTQEAFADTTYTLYGRLPEREDEIAINSCWLNVLLEYGYYDMFTYPIAYNESGIQVFDPAGYHRVSSVQQLFELGAAMNVSDPSDPGGDPIRATIVGVVDYGDCTEIRQTSGGARGYYDCLFVCRSYLEELLAANDWPQGALGSYAVCGKLSSADSVQAVLALSEQDGALRIAPSAFMDTFEQDTKVMNASKLTFALVGVAFGIFASLLIYQLTTLSVNEKRDQIGVLRALGARSLDVYKIFFPESLIISCLSIAAALPLVYLMCRVANHVLIKFFFLRVLLLQFSWAVPIVVIALGLGVTLLSTFFPVHFMAQQQPVDCIRDSK